MSQGPVFNVADAQFQNVGGGGRYRARMGRMAGDLGAQKLGFNVTVLDPGAVSWPYHFHHVNEELFLVLEGSGRLRFNDAEYPLRPGDLVCCPPGPEGAHQIVNDSDAELRYLAVSTVQTPEIAEYPDSDKFAVFHRPDPHDPVPAFRRVGYRTTEVGYWDGEDMTGEDDG